MKKVLFKILILSSIVVLAARFGSQPLMKILGYQSKSGIKITASPEATVFMNGQEIGQTPFQDENLPPGEYQIKLVANSFGKSSWQGRVPLNGGTMSLVHRELAPGIASSSGEILILRPGSGGVFSSTPTESDVEIDGQFYGKTPLIVSSLPVGEHIFVISHSGYITRSIKAALPQKMILNIEVNLAISEVALPIDATPKIKTVAKVIVKQTPTGFLRVRNEPTLKGVEIGRVMPGESLTLVEEFSNWYKVRLEDGTEGYISSLYAQKQF